MPSVKKVREKYVKSFSDLYGNKTNHETFTEISKKILKRHKNTVQLMSSGVLELKNKLKNTLLAGTKDFTQFSDLQIALSKFKIFFFLQKLFK